MSVFERGFAGIGKANKKLLMRLNAVYPNGIARDDVFSEKNHRLPQMLSYGLVERIRPTPLYKLTNYGFLYTEWLKQHEKELTQLSR